MHVIFAKCLFGIDYNRMIDFFKKIYSNWFYYSVKLDEENQVLEYEISKIKIFFEKSYLNQKVKVNSLISSIINNKLSNDRLNRWFYECNVILKSFCNSNDNSEQLYFVYDSLIHMTNNRLGIHLRDESFIAYLIFNSLNDLSEYKNKE